VVGLVFTLGLALLPIQPVRLLADQAVRVMLIAAVALLAGATAARTRVATPLPQPRA
jgi:hypothetical protein